jgi:hypothetical protein
MTTYNELAGLRVNYLSTDPTLNSGNEGQVWYNSTSGTLKSLVQLKAWSAAGNLPVAKNEASSDGTSAAGWIAGGSNTPAGNTGTTATDEYSGYTWASGGNLNTARTLTGGSGFGTQTAAAVAGGATQPGAGPTRTTLTATEEYNGSTWTSVTGLPTATFAAAQCGIQTAGLSFAGTAGYGNPNFNTSLEYDGTNWTSGGNLNNAVIYQAAGIQTAALGMQTSDTAGKGTESYNGTSWTTVANRNTARAQIVGFGTQSLATLAGGYNAGPGTPQLTETEQWDGTAWGISTATLGTATRTGMGIGTVGGGTSGLLAGGYQTNYLANTQEFNSTIFSPATGAWASGGNYPTTTSDLAGFGTQTATLGAGGSLPPGSTTANSVEYDGTSWGSPSTLNTSRGFITGFGIQTAGVAFGAAPAASLTGATELYNGSTWTTSGPLSTARGNAGGAGIQTAGLGFGGYIPPATPSNSSNATEEFGGSTWTAGGNLNTARRGLGGSGTQTAGLAAGGRAGASVSSVTELYNGSTWTSGNDMNYASDSFRMGGTQTATLGAGGYGSPLAPTGSQSYDGTTWSTQPSLGTAVSRGAGGGTQTAGITFAGGSGPGTQTQEFTGTPSTGTASTLTTS